MRPRVLTISKPYVASAYRHKLAAMAARGDLEVGLICPPAWGSQAYEEDPEGRSPPYWVRQVGIAFNGRNHFHFYRGLEAAVRAFRPDILNVEEEHYSLVTLQAFRIAEKVGAKPVFYTWQNLFKRYPPPFNLIERHVFGRAAAAIAGNHEAAGVLRQKGFRGRLAEIPQMGVELAAFAPASPDPALRRAEKHRLGLDPDRFLAVFAGRLVPEKGVGDLLRALAATPALAPAQAVVLGDGPERAALAAQAAALGLGARVKFRAGIPSREVAVYLRAADALVLPSRSRPNWKEQFGRVLVEAMAAEAVPVGSSSGEIPRVIADAGLVYPEGDAPALGAALARLRVEPGLAEALRVRGRARVRAFYTNELIADRFAELFLELSNR